MKSLSKVLKKTASIAAAAVSIILGASYTSAQQGPLQSVNIGGVPMHCRTAYQQLVAIYIHPSVDRHIGIATNNGYPIIVLGPGFFNSVPPLVGQFWFLHECAHHVVGSNEAMADCYAIRNLRNLGLIGYRQQVEQLLFQISQMPGSNRHLPGPARAANIFRCLNS